VLLLRPPTLAVGVGCNRGTGAGEIEAVIRRVLSDASLAPGSVFCLASVEAKRDEAGLHGAAEALGAEARFFSPEEIEGVAPLLTKPSVAAQKALGVPGVAEPCALLAAGVEELLVAKRVSGNVTAAVARRRWKAF